MLNTLLSSWGKCAWYNLPRYLNDLSHCSTWFITFKESGMGSSSHATGRNVRGTETQTNKVSCLESHKKGSYKAEVQQMVSQISSKSPEERRPHRIGLRVSYFLRLSLFHPTKEKDGWHEASYCVCLFPDTLQFARHDLRVVYPNKNPCWEHVLMLSDGMWDWKKCRVQPQPWVSGTWNSYTTTAVTSLPETGCLVRKWVFEHDCKCRNSSGRCSSCLKQMVCKGCLIYRSSFPQRSCDLVASVLDGVLGCWFRSAIFFLCGVGRWYTSNSSSWKAFVIRILSRKGSASGNRQV